MRSSYWKMFVCAAAFGLPQLAHAAGAEPVVLRGYGPETDMYQPAPTQRRQRASNELNLGGGFIEMLVRGGQGTPTARYNSPDDQYVPVQRAPQPMQAPMQQQAAFAPPPAPNAGVRRMVDPMFARQEVEYSGSHPAGTIVVDTPRKFLFLVLGNGRAMRYGIGVGRPGFEWAGVKTITRKAEWPDWRPPAEMLKRRPDLPTFMPGGPENPLGARALYLGSSLYRIHGTNEPFTIGQNVSSGCIRLMNEDVTDLYSRVKVGTRVIVI